MHVLQTEGPGKSINSYLYEAWHIVEALPLAKSIDNFLDTQRGNNKIVLCGKLAIVRSILQSEKNSYLYFDPPDFPKMNMQGLEKTWYVQLFKLLSENCSKNEIKERLKSITFIIFNYDRCIEHFLYNSLQTFYHISHEETIELIKSVSIFHPYGMVGTLPWLNSDGAMDFGGELNHAQLLELSNNPKGRVPRAEHVGE